MYDKNKFYNEDSQRSTLFVLLSPGLCHCVRMLEVSRLIFVLVWSLAVSQVRSECLEVDLDYEGGTVLSLTSQPSPSHCSSSCTARSDCTGWSWGGGRCHLRSALARKVTRLGSVSASAGQTGCLKGLECHYTDNLHLVHCIEGNITR